MGPAENLPEADVMDDGVKEEGMLPLCPRFEDTEHALPSLLL